MNKEVPYECCGNLFFGEGKEDLCFEFKEDLCFRGCGRLSFFGGEEDLCFGDIRKSLVWGFSKSWYWIDSCLIEREVVFD